MSETIYKDSVLVSSQEELDAAYASLTKGDGGTILLAAGTNFVLTSNDKNDLQEDAAVTIRSADPDDPATIEQVKLTNAENLTIEDVRFHMDGDPSTFGDVIFLLNHCTDITVRNAQMTSDAAGPLGTKDALDAAARLALVRNSEDIHFENNVVSGFNHAFALMDSHDVTLTGNDISALQGDAIRVAGVSGMLIEGNHIHDMLGATQTANHSDMIQIWGTRITVNNENITIRENFLDTGNGANYQMIFGHNEDRDENGLTFQNILVEGNVLFGAHGNAIALSDTDGTTVRNNTIVHNADSYDIHADGSVTPSTLINTIRIEGTNAVVENNITQQALNGTNNALLNTGSPFLDTDYRAHFVNVEAGGDGDLRDLMLLPDSVLNGVAGSWLTWSSETATELVAVADVTVDRHDHSVIRLDASLSRGPEGYVVDKGAVFTWVFEDGHTVNGVTVLHDFDTPGRHSYDLIVTMPDGAQNTITRSVTVNDPVAFNLAVEGGQLTDKAANGATVKLHEDAEVKDGWIEIGGRDRVEITRDTTGLFNLNSFNIGLTVSVEQGSQGTLLQLPKTFKATVDGSGVLHVSLTTDAGSFTLASTSALFADETPHSLSIRYDGAKGTLSLMVDDQLDATVEAHGMTAPASHWGLTIGDAWKSAVDAQVKDVYLVSENADPFEGASPTSFPASLTVVPETDSLTEVDAAPAPLEVEEHFTAEEGFLSESRTILLALDFEDDVALDTSKAGAQVDQRGTGVHLVKDDQLESRVLEIDGPASAIAVDRDHDALYEQDTFIFSLDMRSDTADGRKVFGIHKAYQLDVEDDDLVFTLNTNEGAFSLATDTDFLADRDWHNVQIGYSDASDLLQIVVDGEVLAATSASGVTPEASHWGFDIGNRWGEGFEGAIDNFIIFAEPDIA